MLYQIKVILVTLLGVTLADNDVPGLDRAITDDMKSVSSQYNIIYGDNNVKLVNEKRETINYEVIDGNKNIKVVKEIVQVTETVHSQNNNNNIFEAIEPLPREDVKCLMSSDNYCSQNMRLMKDVLIQAIKEDCEKCLAEEKYKAGQIVATMLIHDPVAWKLFLTRTTLLLNTNKVKRFQEYDYKPIGQPEEIFNKRNRHIFKGKNVKVRVRKYATEIIPK